MTGRSTETMDNPENQADAIVIRDLESLHPADGVLKIPELVVAAGERVCIQGSNGSGKTSLLRALTGLLGQYSGKLQVLGNELMAIHSSKLERMRAEQVGFIFQHYRLVPYLSAYDNILLPCYFSERRRKAAAARAGSEAEDAFRLIRQLSLRDPSRLSKNASEYSAGQQQRFAIARALIGRPALVLADEPASA
ncbi:MAG: ATP-binding cassette domain-containing protein, partial [Endozoicomonas sp.]